MLWPDTKEIKVTLYPTDGSDHYFKAVFLCFSLHERKKNTWSSGYPARPVGRAIILPRSTQNGSAKLVLSAVSDVEKSISILAVVIYHGHGIACGWQGLALLSIFFRLYKNPQGLLWAQLDALSDNIGKLADGEIAWDQVLLLINVSNLWSCRCLLDDNRNAVVILAPNFLSFTPPLLEIVGLLEALETHDGVLISLASLDTDERYI